MHGKAAYALCPGFHMTGRAGLTGFQTDSGQFCVGDAEQAGPNAEHALNDAFALKIGGEGGAGAGCIFRSTAAGC